MSRTPSEVALRARDGSATEEMDMETAHASQPLKGLRLVITLTGLCFAVFCVALDNTIIATAIPYITDQFENLNDVGWYGSVYLLTTCAFQLLYGKLYKFFSIKLVFLTGLFIFEVGSLICGVAPNSISLIVGSRFLGCSSQIASLIFCRGDCRFRLCSCMLPRQSLTYGAENVDD